MQLLSQTHSLAMWQLLTYQMTEHRTNADPDLRDEEFYYTMGSELRMKVNLDLV